MADLTTLDAVKVQLGLQGTVNGAPVNNTSDDGLIAAYVSQASALFESQALHATGISFIAAPGTLLLDACPPHTYGPKLFFRLPVRGVYSVVNGDGQTLTSSDYRLLPPNAVPYYGLELKRNSGKYWAYTNSPEEAITVAGTLGYVLAGTIPGDVSLAVTKAAAYLYQTRDNKGEVIRFADGSSQVPGSIPELFEKVIRRYATVRIHV